MRVLLLALVVACGGTKPTASPVSNQGGAAPASSPDAGEEHACNMACSTDEVGCLLAEHPPACCVKYDAACRLDKSGNGTGS